jgi:poly-gamma-glutamate biosynthesis protein PgsC/CapC
MMYGYLFTEVERFAFILGIVLSIVLYNRLHLSTGSIIVPGCVGVYILQPALVAGTFVNALFAFWLVYHILPRFTLMHASAKFFALIAISGGLQVLWLEVSPHPLWEMSPALRSVGYVIPGMIAHAAGRQGLRKTLISVAGSVLIVGGVVLVITALYPEMTNDKPLAAFDSFTFDTQWMPLAVLCSILSAGALRHNYGFKAGGFVGAAYLSLILARPVQVVYCLVLSLLTYLITTRVLMPSLILFGRRKSATMLLVGTMLSWGTLLLQEQAFGSTTLPWSFQSLELIGMIVPGLLANDAERFGVLRVLQGTALSVVFTLTATLLIIEIAGQPRIDVTVLLALLVAGTGAVIFRTYIHAILQAVWAAASDPQPAQSRPEGGRSRTVWAANQAGWAIDPDRCLYGVAFALFVLAIAVYMGTLPVLSEVTLWSS